MPQSKVILHHKIFMECLYNIINKKKMLFLWQQKIIYGEEIDFPLHLQSIKPS
jgi:hypothetical protein